MVQEGSHPCRHVNVTRHRRDRPWFCNHPVADHTGYRFCGQAGHRYGSHEALWQLFHGFPARNGLHYTGTPKESRNIAQPQGDSHSIWGYGSIPDENVEIAKWFAEEWTTREDWRQEIERKAKAALGDDYQRSWSRSTLRMCKQLAREAERLLNLTAQAEQAIEDLLSPALSWIRPTPLQRIIAQKFAKHITAAAGLGTLTAVARALRCYGVFICAVDDRVDLLNCHCLRPLAKSEITAKIKSEVEAAVARGFKPLVIRPGEGTTA